MRTFKITLLLTVVMFAVTSCATSLYNQYSFTKTLETKTEAITLIDVSDSPYAEHETEVKHLQNLLAQMVAYEQARERNEISAKMWQYLASDASSLQKFLKLWQEQNTMNAAFTEEFKPQIAHIFDLMADYESKKSKESESALLNLLTE